MSSHYFNVLGLSEDSDFTHVKKRYLELIDYYNDKLLSDPSQKLEIEEKIKEVNNAYDYLTNNVFNSTSNVFNKNTSNSGYSYNNVNGKNSTAFIRIRSLIENKNLDEAMSELLKIEERDAEWNFLMGKVSLEQGWQDKAYSHFKLASEIDPNNNEYKETYNSFVGRATTYRRDYNTRTEFDSDNCCRACCSLWCLDCFCERCCCCDPCRCC